MKTAFSAPRQRGLKPLVLAIQLGVATCVSLSATQAQANEPSALNQTLEFAVPAGPLASVLNQFAAQSGVLLSGIGAQTQGLLSEGVSGQHSVKGALTLLLQGTGLTFKVTAQNRVVVFKPGESANLTDSDAVELASMLVEAHRDPIPLPNAEGRFGQQVINQAAIESTPGTDNNLTDLLRSNTAVDYSRSGSSSGSSGSLRPEEISIHGQSYYQNLFMLDGVDTTSDINPGSGGDSYTSPINPASLSMLGGSSPQSYYVDTDALEQVAVYDVNIPAEYGGFTGGVVDARLKRYNDKDSLSIKYGTERDAWERFHVDESYREDFSTGDSYDGSFTPEYKKQNFALTATKQLGESTGSTLTVSRRTSRFLQNYTDLSGQVFNIHYNDRIDNVMGRIDTSLSDHVDLGFSLRYADRQHDGLTSSAYDSMFTRSHNALGLGAELTYHFDHSQLDVKLAFDRSQDELRSDLSSYSNHPTNNYYNLPTTEGGYGDVTQQQDAYTAKVGWKPDTFNAFGLEHDLSLGGELRHVTAFYELPGEIESEVYRCLSGSTRDGCDDVNSDGVHNSDDEYLYSRSISSANRLEEEYVTAALYLQDKMRWNNWTFNAGARVEKETLLENLNVSPRLSAEWDVFGDQSTRLIAGASRYYGRSFLRYKVNDTLRSWRTVTFYNDDGSVRRVATYDDRSLENYDLKTPYSDERVLGVEQQMGQYKASLKLVNRESKDIVSRSRDDDGLYFYSNDGSSSTDSVSLELTRQNPFVLGNSRTFATLGLGWKESESTVQSSDDAYDETYQDEIVYYKNRLIDRDQMPAWDFNVPITVKFNTHTSFPNWNLTWSNFLNIRRGGTVARSTGEDYTAPNGDEFSIYEDYDFKNLLTVDTQLVWKPHVFQNEGYLRLNIRNLLDDTVITSTSSTKQTYSPGRKVSLEFGMRF
jgi:hypothetical protein